MSDTTMMAVVPRVSLNIRAATRADVVFMDRLQKQHGKALGYFPTKQFEGYVDSGGVLVAWAPRPCFEDDTGEAPVPLGYIISRDRYLKRDELGVVYQLCVAPGLQRKLVGAALVREVSARSAYGCKLYCCWCAQDLEANYFWESMGFIPLAFRTGSGRKGRTHIFWQRRITADDTTTPFWFPSQTSGGAIREDRLVLPIPPGTHWRDVMPVLLPAARPALEAERASTARTSGRRAKSSGNVANGVRESGGLRLSVAPVADIPVLKRKREKKPKVKNDPAHVAAARELRDRVCECYNSRPVLTTAKYAVERLIESRGAPAQPALPGPPSVAA